MHFRHYTLYSIHARLLALLGTTLGLFAVVALRAASTQTATFQNGISGYSGALEVGIEKGKGKLPAANLNLWIGREADRLGDTPKRESQALVRFDGIFGDKPSQIPLGSSITKATLRLCVGSDKDAVSFHRVYLNRMLVPWDANVTWKNPRWGDDGIKASGKDAVTRPDALFVPNRNNTAYNIDVTESLRAWAAGEPNHGWVLHTVRNQYAPAAFITSRISDTKCRPMLIVSYDQPGITPLAIKNLSSSPSGINAATLSLTIETSPALMHHASAIQNPKSTIENTVTFYGRKRIKAGSDFEVVILPDTQYYCSQKHGGKAEMFYSQTQWLVKNHKKRGIAFVLHMGDITDTGDVYENEWKIASEALCLVEDPKITGLPDGIPYILNVGNHDQFYEINGKRLQFGPASLYNKYFGVDRFKGRAYYGENFGNDNNNYYTLFEGGAQKFIAISLEHDFSKRNPDIAAWAKNLLDQYPDRHGIIITHAALLPGIPATFIRDGQNAYDSLKNCPNLRFIFGGHTAGEGWRADKHNGSLVYSITQDFQQDAAGGNGWLVILAFSPVENQVRVRIYSPYIDQWRTDEYATYALDYDFGTKIEPFVKIATVKPKLDGTVTHCWSSLAPSTDYEWYAEVTDGQKTTRTGVALLKR